MKKSTVSVLLATALMFWLTFYAVQSSASKEIIKMVGEITAIEGSHNTVVVEVPVGKTTDEEQFFTVGGRLAPDADLIKGSKPARLEDFEVGDRVTVKWQPIETGHLILSLQANPK